MKKLLSIILTLMLLLAAMPAALADITPDAYYIVAETIVESVTGVEPLGSASDPDFEGTMAIMLAESDETSNAQIIVIGPEGSYTLWDMGKASTLEMDHYFAQIVEAWQPFGYEIEGYQFGIIFFSEQFSEGAMTVMNSEDAQTQIAAYSGSDDGADEEEPTIQSTRPVVPSAYSFSDYRLPCNDGLDDYGQNYVYIKKDNASTLMNFAQDYITLLTEQYDFEVVDTYTKFDDWHFYVLDYVGVGEIRPVANNSGSGDVIITVYMDLSSMTVTYSSSFDYLETDDRTTVNLR